MQAANISLSVMLNPNKAIKFANKSMSNSALVIEDTNKQFFLWKQENLWLRDKERMVLIKKHMNSEIFILKLRWI